VVKNDIAIADLSFISPRVARRLEKIDVKTARQMFHRMQHDREEMREYLDVGQSAFETIVAELRTVIEREFPRELLPSVTPNVSKRGVAVHRTRDASRPKYYDAEDVYVPPRGRH
jgi:hypothetical protein